MHGFLVVSGLLVVLAASLSAAGTKIVN